MARLPSICSTDAPSAITEHSSTTPNFDPQPPGWLDYEPAERDLFEVLNGPDGYARVLASDYGHQFGPDVANDEIVADFAEALFPKAAGVLCQQGTRQVFGDDHLFAKCQQWARYWCEIQREREQYKIDKAAAIAQNDADRLAWALARYGGWEGFAKGQEGSREKRSSKSKERQELARRLRNEGRLLWEVAVTVGVCIRQISRYLKVELDEVIAEIAHQIKNRTLGKSRASTDPQNRDDGTRTAFAKCPTPDKATQTVRDRHEIRADERCRGPDPGQAAAEMAARFPQWAESLARIPS